MAPLSCRPICLAVPLLSCPTAFGQAHALAIRSRATGHEHAEGPLTVTFPRLFSLNIAFYDILNYVMEFDVMP